jgi:hypothetical protein
MYDCFRLPAASFTIHSPPPEVGHDRVHDQQLEGLVHHLGRDAGEEVELGLMGVGARVEDLVGCAGVRGVVGSEGGMIGGAGVAGTGRGTEGSVDCRSSPGGELRSSSATFCLPLTLPAHVVQDGVRAEVEASSTSTST